MVAYSSYDDELEAKFTIKRRRGKNTVSELKRELGMFGLSSEGKKQDLQDRLASHLQKPRNATFELKHKKYIFINLGVIEPNFLIRFLKT